MSCISDGFRGRVIAQEAPLPLWNPGNVDRCASAIENTWTLVKDWGLSVGLEVFKYLIYFHLTVN